MTLGQEYVFHISGLVSAVADIILKWTMVWPMGM
jgi:hypothetical protein